MSLHPDCLAELNLQRPPFDELPSEDFVYNDDLLDELIDDAVEAAAAPGAILMLAGDDGSGRSMQLMRLLGSMPENYELIAFRARLNTPFEAVDSTIRNRLRAAGHDDPDRPLTDLLAARIREGFDPVIAVDDAHLLGMDIINILLRIRSDILISEGRAPRLVLAGDAVLLRRHLPLRPVDEDQTAHFKLRPFSLEQTEDYLRHRLSAAGMKDVDSVLTRDVVADLQAESKGLPGALNRHANDWLQRLCRARTMQPPTPVPTTGITPEDEVAPERNVLLQHEILSEDTASRAPLTETTIPESDTAAEPRVAASREEIPDDGFGDDSDPDLRDRAPPKVPLDADGPVDNTREHTAPQREAPITIPNMNRDTHTSSLRASDSDRHVPTWLRREADPAPTQPPIPFWSRTWFVPAVAALVAFLILAPFARHLLDRPPTPPTSAVELPLPISQMPAPAEAVPGPAMDDARPAFGEIPFDKPPARIPEPSPPPAPAPRAAPAPEPAAAPPPAQPRQPAPEASGLAADRDWLARQNSGHLTIQLIATQDLAAAIRFVERHDLTGIRFIQTRSGGQDFVVALAGSFASRAAAENAARNLPEAVRANQPWIRSLGSLQDIQR